MKTLIKNLTDVQKLKILTLSLIFVFSSLFIYLNYFIF